MVLLYQLFFILIIIGSSFFGLGAFLMVSLFAILFTFANVFTAELLVLQTSVIVGAAIIGIIIASFVSISRNGFKILVFLVLFMIFKYHGEIIGFLWYNKKIIIGLLVIFIILKIILDKKFRLKLKDTICNKQTIIAAYKNIPLIILTYGVYFIYWLIISKFLIIINDLQFSSIMLMFVITILVFITFNSRVTKLIRNIIDFEEYVFLKIDFDEYSYVTVIIFLLNCAYSYKAAQIGIQILSSK